MVGQSRSFSGARARLGASRRTVRARVVSVKTPEPVTESKTKADKFSWTKSWYPVINTADLRAKPQEPRAVKLLGKDIVLWSHDEGKTWNASDDRCPHRLAPLSEGRLTPAIDGQSWDLQCAYHGWQFDGCGKCKKIPQATPEGAKIAMEKCPPVKQYATRIEAGLLWVFPDESENAYKTAEETELFIPEDVKERLQDSEDTDMPAWYMRDLSYGHDILLENLCDPSHLPFSHAGFGGLNREMPEKTKGHEIKLLSQNEMKADENIDEGVTLASRTTFISGGDSNLDSLLMFRAPYWVGYRNGIGANQPKQKKSQTGSVQLYAIPTEPGKARVFLLNLVPKPTAANSNMGILLGFFRALPVLMGSKINSKMDPQKVAMAKFAVTRLRFLVLRAMIKFLPHMRHTLNSNIFDGDGVFLTQQQNLVYEGNARPAAFEDRKNATWAKDIYYTPTSADAMILAMRRWMDNQGGGHPDWQTESDNVPIQTDTSQKTLINRYEQHTKHCSLCSGALDYFTQMKKTSGVVAILSASAAFASLIFVALAHAAKTAISVPKGPVLSVVAIFSIAALIAKKFQDFAVGQIQTLTYIPYNHASVLPEKLPNKA